MYCMKFCFDFFCVKECCGIIENNLVTNAYLYFKTENILNIKKQIFKLI